MLHDYVRAARERQRLTQRQVAELSGIQRSRYLLFEKHGSNITVDSLRKLVKVLPDLQHLPLGEALGLQDTAATPLTALRAAVVGLRGTADQVLQLLDAQPSSAEPAEATELRDGGTEVTPQPARELRQASTKARASRHRRQT